MRIIPCKADGLCIIEPKVFGDERGFFLEAWNHTRYPDGLDFTQDNVSFSKHGVLRGLHFQNPNSQAKLVQVLQGLIYDVAVDLRQSSATFGRWESALLSSENHFQFLIPVGFAHGFVVLSESALVSYKTTGRYDPASEFTLAWDDPTLAIDWPIKNPQLSVKDSCGAKFNEMPRDRLFP